MQVPSAQHAKAKAKAKAVPEPSCRGFLYQEDITRRQRRWERRYAEVSSGALRLWESPAKQEHFGVLYVSGGMVLDLKQEPAPEWEEGKDSCFRCLKRFSLIRRRHHCRGCGRALCGDCSAFECPLPFYGDNVPVRVCEACLGTAKERMRKLCVRPFASDDHQEQEQEQEQEPEHEQSPDNKTSTTANDNNNNNGDDDGDGMMFYFTLPPFNKEFTLAVKTFDCEVWFCAESEVEREMWVAALTAASQATTHVSLGTRSTLKLSTTGSGNLHVRTSRSSSIGGPPAELDAPVVEWEAEDVRSWLYYIGLEHHVDAFYGSHVTGRELLRLDERDLAQLLGVRSLFDRKKIIAYRDDAVAHGVLPFLEEDLPAISETSTDYLETPPQSHAAPNRRTDRRDSLGLRPMYDTDHKELVSPHMASFAYQPGEEVAFWDEDSHSHHIGVITRKMFDVKGEAEARFEVKVTADGKTAVFPADSLLKFREAHIEWFKGQLLGKGAYGKVWEGLNILNGAIIAIKEMRLNSLSAQASNDLTTREIGSQAPEISLMQTLRHPNVVRFLGTEIDEDASKLYIFMERVSGGSIRTLIDKFGPLPEKVVVRYTRQICEGLLYLHRNRVIHRDLKGSNVLVSTDGTIKLADFGVAKKLEEVMDIKKDVRMKTNLQTMVGSPYHMAPEVIRQEGYGRKADIWGLACTVIEMLTGQNPWGDMNQLAAVFAIGNTEKLPPFPEDISADCEDFLTVCLQRDKTKRPSARLLLRHRWLLQAVSASKPSYLSLMYEDELTTAPTGTLTRSHSAGPSVLQQRPKRIVSSRPNSEQTTRGGRIDALLLSRSPRERRQTTPNSDLSPLPPSPTPHSAGGLRGATSGGVDHQAKRRRSDALRGIRDVFAKVHAMRKSSTSGNLAMFRRRPRPTSATQGSLGGASPRADEYEEATADDDNATVRAVPRSRTEPAHLDHDDDDDGDGGGGGGGEDEEEDVKTPKQAKEEV